MSKNIVSLEGMEFYAFHGFYEEERVKGNDFVVDVHITTDFQLAAQNDDLEGTFNYEEIYRVVKEEMAIPTKLLESVAQRIIDRLSTDNKLTSIEVSLAKKNPPVGGQVKQSRITISKEVS